MFFRSSIVTCVLLATVFLIFWHGLFVAVIVNTRGLYCREVVFVCCVADYVLTAVPDQDEPDMEGNARCMLASMMGVFSCVYRCIYIYIYYFFGVEYVGVC